MLVFVSFLAVLAFLNVCCARGELVPVRPPSRHARRSGVESIEAGVVNWGNTTTPLNSAIISVWPSLDGQSYYSVIEVGNISFRVSLDTGSADAWLVSSACTTSTCNDVPKYQLAYHSPTFQAVNNNLTAFNVSFADGTFANGFDAFETFSVANLTVDGQAFGVVTNSNITLTDEISGILGLGFPRLSTINQFIPAGSPFFATMAQRGQLEYPLFGLNLGQNSTGSLTFGAVDGSVVENITSIVWNEVMPFAPFGTESNTTSYLQWTIPLGGISVNGTAVNPEPTYSNLTSTSIALLDVGTPGIYGPFQDVSRIYAAIPGSRLVDAAGQWVIPCDANHTIAFKFGGQTFVMQPTDYLIGPTSGTPDLCLSWPRASAPSSDGIDWQLGTPFLRTVYSVFSFGIDTKEPPQIGLYPLRNASAPVESPQAVASFFSAQSATVGTNLPNFLIPTPSPAVPSYTFNTSFSTKPGQIVSSGLATSTYSAAIGTHHVNATAIPTLSPSPTLFTLILTSDGQLVTSVSTAASPSITLGTPPGWTNASPATLRMSLGTIAVSVLVPSLLFFARLVL
ncbi:A1 family peptidase [Phanerochaete sordida]|uniref:A1 family peptidase n=1 Tax=Phanerochaete sordida TaxID=48140 RepID=A0A9P3LCD0_9APHY|nr:A1 family peptidase [Phanerochaete sordida]